MNFTNTIKILVLVFTLIFVTSVHAQTSLIGYNTNGEVFQIDPNVGTLTSKGAQEIHSFSLGAIARSQSMLYYVAAPSGATENAIFTANTKTGAITSVDLDRADADDEVVALFFGLKKLHGLFYNSNTGDHGIYRINPKTGVTKLILNLKTLNLEPVAGSITRIGQFIYILAKPSSDSSRRQLVRFKVNSNIVKVTEVETSGDTKTPILCDRLKLIRKTVKFLCLASPTTSQVDVYRLNTQGKGVYLDTLNGIERIAGGHSMVTPDEKSFYAFVYATGETNNQRLIKLSSSGQLKGNAVINTLIVGARFGKEEPEEE